MGRYHFQQRKSTPVKKLGSAGGRRQILKAGPILALLNMSPECHFLLP